MDWGVEAPSAGRAHLRGLDRVIVVLTVRAPQASERKALSDYSFQDDQDADRRCLLE